MSAAKYLRSDARQWLTVAIEAGAKISRAANGLYVVLDEPDSFLWDSYFLHPEAAARAYARVYALRWPDTAASAEAVARARPLQIEWARARLATARRLMRASEEEEARAELARLGVSA